MTVNGIQHKRQRTNMCAKTLSGNHEFFLFIAMKEILE